MKYYVGIDLGGTNTKIGLVDEKGNIIFTTIVKTDSMEGFSETIQRLSNISFFFKKHVYIISLKKNFVKYWKNIRNKVNLYWYNN